MNDPVALPCFNDNYIWTLPTSQGCWVVDPGDAGTVRGWLGAHQLSLAGILLTHHHADHTGGVNELREAFGCPVWGPDECSTWRTDAVDDRQVLMLPGLGAVEVLWVGAHTLGHVAYHLPRQGWLFCGDALFSAGCGRLFEGTAEDLQRALRRLNDLPAHTRVFPTHEYTVSNLHFATQVEPGNDAIRSALDDVLELRRQGLPSLPTHLAREREINPFLRAGSPEVRTTVANWSGQLPASDLETVRLLRQWKDVFRVIENPSFQAATP